MSLHYKNTLIVICGPTASGKTSLSLEIAQLFNAEIISADSRQFYHDLKIGVATPNEQQLSSVKHHFIGNLSVLENYNVSRFESDVIKFLNNYFKTRKLALMVGGSGLYIDAVCKGIDDLPDPNIVIRNQLKEILRKDGLESLKLQLKELDPEYYKTIDKSNPNRILRALEVCLNTGKSFTSFHKNKKKGRNFNILKIGLSLSRADLYERINKRVDQMIEAGLVEEVKRLIPYRKTNALNTVGYKEIFGYLDCSQSLEYAIEKIKTNTRRYAKRQLTWFKKDSEIHWFHPEEQEKIVDFIRNKTSES